MSTLRGHALSDRVTERNLRWGWLRSLGTGHHHRWLHPQTQLAMILSESGRRFCLETLRYKTMTTIELNQIASRCPLRSLLEQPEAFRSFHSDCTFSSAQPSKPVLRHSYIQFQYLFISYSSCQALSRPVTLTSMMAIYQEVNQEIASTMTFIGSWMSWSLPLPLHECRRQERHLL